MELSSDLSACQRVFGLGARGRKRECWAQTARQAGPGMAWVKGRGTGKRKQEAQEALVTKFYSIFLDTRGLENRVTTSRRSGEG